MKKKILMLMSIVFTLSIVYTIPIRQTNAKENIVSEETKSYCEATLDHDFADNRIIVVLNKAATMNFKTYTPIDFPETRCVKVNNSNEYTRELVQRKIRSRKTGLKIQENTELDGTVNVDSFRTILTLELAENNKEKVLETIKKLELREDVISVEPDYRMTYFATPTPTPTYYSQQWAIDRLNLPQAWDITTGNSSVVVGVIDSGINGNHPDLKDRIATGLCGNFTTSSVTVSNPTDSVGHGTAVAGIIGAQRNSGTPGITGVAQNIKLASLQINNPDEDGNGSNVEAFVTSAIRAIDFADKKGIPIINLSSGYDAPYGTSAQTNSLKTAIQSYPGLVICAAGNGTNNNGIGKNNDSNAIYPANFDLPNLISVGASNKDDTIRTDSNFGKTTVDLFAPGHDIRTTDLGSSYTYQDYTSMAAPHVAGVAALIKSINPNLTPAQIKAAILNNVDKGSYSGTTGLSSLYGKCVSNGRLNAHKAISSVAFQLNTKGNAITGLNFTWNGELTIPNTINGIAITEIGNSAFVNQIYGSSIYLPSSIKSIGTNAFKGCTKLKNISLSSDNIELNGWKQGGIGNDMGLKIGDQIYISLFKVHLPNLISVAPNQNYLVNVPAGFMIGLQEYDSSGLCIYDPGWLEGNVNRTTGSKTAYFSVSLKRIDNKILIPLGAPVMELMSTKQSLTSWEQGGIKDTPYQTYTLKKYDDLTIVRRPTQMTVLSNHNYIVNVPTGFMIQLQEYGSDSKCTDSTYSTNWFEGNVSITTRSNTKYLSVAIKRSDGANLLPSKTPSLEFKSSSYSSLESIGANAFSGCTSLAHITLPSTVTTIESNAFLNTNNARINIQEKPEEGFSFNIYWNSSNNPVYLDGALCSHTSKTESFDSLGHTSTCDDCRTSHDESHSYLYLWKNYTQHISRCECGFSRTSGHMVPSSWNGVGYTNCLECGGLVTMGFIQLGLKYSIQNTINTMAIIEYFGNGSYVLSNGIIVLSEIDIIRYYDGTLILPDCEHC